MGACNRQEATIDDFVLNVRQISQFPLTDTAGTSDAILLQQGGIGGAYKYTTPAGVVGPFTDPLTTQLNALQIQFSGFNQTLADYQTAWTDHFSTTIDQIKSDNLFTINALFENSVRSFNGERGDVVFTLADMQQLGAAASHNPRFTGTALLNGDPLVTASFVRDRFEQTFTLNNMLCLGVAPIDSPPLQGRPTAPTPPQGDSSNRLATTMFASRRFRAIEQDIDLKLDEGLSTILREINDQIVPLADAAIQALLGDVEFATKDWVTDALAGIDLSAYLPLKGGTLDPILEGRPNPGIGLRIACDWTGAALTVDASNWAYGGINVNSDAGATGILIMATGTGQGLQVLTDSGADVNIGGGNTALSCISSATGADSLVAQVMSFSATPVVLRVAGTNVATVPLDIIGSLNTTNPTIRMRSDSAATPAGDGLGVIGFGGGVSGTASVTSARIVGLATQAWSPTQSGSQLLFQTTPNGATAPVTRISIGHDGRVDITGSLYVNGTQVQ